MNFVLVVADSLRADRISGSGYPRATTPFLDRLAERGVRFERAFTPVAPTRPAIATLLSGQSPLTHGIVGKRYPRRPRAAMFSLPAALARAGFRTLVVDGMADRGGSPWLRRGFGTQVALGADGSRPRAQEFNGVIRDWLARRPGAPFFVYARYGDTHTPYLPPPRYRHLFYEGDPTARNLGSLASFWERPHRGYFVDGWERPLREAWPDARGARIEDVGFFRAMYDSCVRAFDDGMEELAAILADARALDDTLLVVTADHGESLGEHDLHFAHVGLHDCVLRVPCIFAGAGVRAAGRRVGEAIELTDLAPTLLDLAGVPPPAALDGRSLAPWLAASAPDPRSDRPRLACEATYRASWALRTATHKTIVPRQPGLPVEIYDLQADPGEHRDLARSEPELRDALVRELEETLAAALAARGLDADPVAAALGRVHAPRARKRSLWRVAQRAVRDVVHRAGAAARLATGARGQLWERRNGSSRPEATAQTM